jgi:hypothetical protein
VLAPTTQQERAIMADIEDEPLFSELNAADKEMLEFARTTTASINVKDECQRELEFGRMHGWSIRLFKRDYKKV